MDLGREGAGLPPASLHPALAPARFYGLSAVRPSLSRRQSICARRRRGSPPGVPAPGRPSRGLLLGRQYERLAPRTVPFLRDWRSWGDGGCRLAGPVQIFAGGRKLKIRRSHLGLPVIQLQNVHGFFAPAGPGMRFALRVGFRRSLRRLLMDRKIPAQVRDAMPVVAAGDQILGVGGIGVNLDFAALCRW